MRRFLLIFLLLHLLPVTSDPSIQGDQVQNGFDVVSIHTSIDLSLQVKSYYSLVIQLNVLQGNQLEILEIDLPVVLSNLTVEVDNKVTAFRNSGSTFTHLEVTPTSTISGNQTVLVEVRGSFDADLHGLEDASYQLFFDWDLSLFCDNMTVSILLPPYSKVHRTGDDLSVFPTNTAFGSNGERIIVVWSGLYNTGSASTVVFVQFSLDALVVPTDSPSWSIWTTVLLLLLVITLAGFGYYYLHHRKIPSVEENTRVVTTVKPVILSPQEMEILQIIAQYEGGILQSELVEVLGYSRARVSQYLASFESRGLISKHRAGRQNYITLAAEMVFEQQS